MTDYRSTVHVPVTSFPMRGDLLNRQEEILARWQAQDLYRAILEDRRDAQPFIIHDGPPYASGQVHVGIGLKRTLSRRASERVTCEVVGEKRRSAHGARVMSVENAVTLISVVDRNADSFSSVSHTSICGAFRNP